MVYPNKKPSLKILVKELKFCIYYPNKQQSEKLVVEKSKFYRIVQK